MSHRRSVAISVATFIAASLAPVTPAMASSRVVQVHTPVSCVFTLPTLGLDARTVTLLSGVRRANDCADGPLAVIVPESRATATAAAGPAVVAREALAMAPAFGATTAALATATRRGTSIALVIADQGWPTFFPGRIQPIPPSPLR